MNKYEKQIKFFKNSIEGLKAQLEKAEGEKKTAIENRIKEAEEVVAELEALANNKDAEDAARKLAAIENRVLTVENGILKNSVKPVDVKKVMNSREYVVDFLAVVKNSENKDDFKRNLMNMAQGKYNIGNSVALADFLPGFMLNEINDVLTGNRHRLLELVQWTGLPVYKAFFETQGDGANFYPLGTEEEKSEQSQDYTPIEIRPIMLYKLVRLDREIEKASEAQGDVIVRYLTTELLDRLLWSVEAAILHGSSIGSTTYFHTPVVKSLIADEYDARAYMQNANDAIAIMSTATFLKIKNELQSKINGMLLGDDAIRGAMGVREIVISMYAENDTVYYMNPSEYKLAGDRRPDQYEDFNLSYNKREYLMELYVGGGAVIPDNFVKVQIAQ